MLRREFLSLAAASAAAQSANVRHILLTASHDRLLVKASFPTAYTQAPLLRVKERFVTGIASDTRGYFWQFDVPGLTPSTEHVLQLHDGRRRALNDPWTVKTFPDLSSKESKLRLLVYTCAGGDEKTQFLPIATRQRLFRRALAFAPDAVIGNGDHIYWDLRQTGAPPRYSDELIQERGAFSRSLPVLGTSNEKTLTNVGDAQIGSLYGTMFQSLPVFFTQDDHDYFENDDADEEMVTYPPDHFMLQCGRGIRRLYFPEFLPDPNRPIGLPGASAADRPPNTGECFGTLRYGTLAELLLYDCRRYLSLAGPNAGMIPREAERWITRRLLDSETTHLVQVPSLPPVWSAGKWGDWYPDYLDANGELSLDVTKPYWQTGWAKQHDRIMKATSEQKSGRIPLFFAGDMHAHGHAQILRTGEEQLKKNPVHVHLSGCISTTTRGFPSGVRRTPPKPTKYIDAEMKQNALEENGFLIVDFTEASIRIRSFKWRPPAPETAIDTLEPFRDITLPRTV